MASQRAASSRVRSDASLIADVSATLCRDLGLGAVNKSLGKRAVSDAIRFSGRFAQFLEKVRGTGDVSEPVAKQIHEQVARRVDLAVKQLQHEAKSSGAGGGGIAVAGFGTVGNVERLPGTISGAAGGLIAGGLMKPTKRSRSGQQKGSSLGLDRLARAKRDQNGVGDRVAAAQKRRRMQGMSMALSVDGDDDDAAAGETGGAAAGGSRTLQARPRQYRRQRMETPSHPGGVNVQAQDAIRARGRDQAERRRSATAASGDGGDRGRRDEGRDRDRDRDRGRRDRDQGHGRSSRDDRGRDQGRDRDRRSDRDQGYDRRRDDGGRDRRDRGYDRDRGHRSSSRFDQSGSRSRSSGAAGGADRRMLPPSRGGGEREQPSKAPPARSRWGQPPSVASYASSSASTVLDRDGIGANFDEWEQPELLRSVEPATPLATPQRDAMGGTPMRDARSSSSSSGGGGGGGGEWEDATPLRVGDVTGTPMRSERSASTHMGGGRGGGSSSSHDATPAYVYNRWAKGGRDGRRGAQSSTDAGGSGSGNGSSSSRGGAAARMKDRLEDQYDEAFYDPDGAGAHEAGSGGVFLGDKNRFDEMEAKMAAQRAKGQRVTAKKSALNADQMAWENQRLAMSGVMETGRGGVVEIDESGEERLRLQVHYAKPPFLDGRLSFTDQQAMVPTVKDVTADIAVMARKGSQVLQEYYHQRETMKMRQRFWELGGSKMGKAMGLKEEEEEEDPDADLVDEAGNVDFKSASKFAMHMMKQKQKEAAMSAMSEDVAAAAPRTGQHSSKARAARMTMREQRESLPIFQVRAELLQVIADNQVRLCPLLPPLFLWYWILY